MSDEAKKQAQAKQAVKVEWNDSKMQTTYANVVNASSTKEEVSIFFGTNQTWNLADDKELKVDLSDRIILNPHTAKRLTVLLGGIINEYEKRFGELSIDAKQAHGKLN